VSAAPVAYVLAVDEHVDVLADGAGLVADRTFQRGAAFGQVVEQVAQGRAVRDVDGQDVVGRAGVLLQRPVQPQVDPHAAHPIVAARTVSTSGRYCTTVVKLSPSSALANTVPLRVPR
jgi:hypothetical protein